MTGLAELILVLAVLYWVGNRYKMVDVLTNIQDLYLKWESRSPAAIAMGPASDTPSGATAFDGGGGVIKEPQQNQRAVVRGPGLGLVSRAVRTRIRNRQTAPKYAGFPRSSVAYMKWTPRSLPSNAVGRPSMNFCCKSCLPNSRKLLINEEQQMLGLKNILTVPTQGPHNNFFVRAFSDVIFCLQVKKFDYPHVYSTVLNDERLKQALDYAVKQDLEERTEPADKKTEKALRNAHESRAASILQIMGSTISMGLLRFAAWIVLKLVRRFMTISMPKGQIDMIRKAAQTGLPLIFVPLHRSHLDYIIITFILLTHNIRPPLIAAGDNLRIPFFGSLLRGLGAFYIKRKMDPATGRKDIIYRSVLHTYMMEILRAGHNLEFFIEGGRSRTGKACLPKGGLLSIVLDAYKDGVIEDALLIPVGINYDKVVEGNFVRELLGQPKIMESFSGAIKATWDVLNTNCGFARIDFSQPFSLREFLQTNQELLSPCSPIANGKNGTSKRVMHHAPSSTSLYGTDVVTEEHREIVEHVARHVVYDGVQATAIMSTNVVSFLLLNYFPGGVTLDGLVIAVDRMRRELHSRSRDVGFKGHSIDVINHALKLLGPGLVRKEKQPRDRCSEEVTILKPVTLLPNVIELSYYSNGALSAYTMDCIVATSVFSLVNIHLPSHRDMQLDVTLSKDDLIERALELCELLQFEFLFSSPCRDIEEVIEEAVDAFLSKELLQAPEEATDEQQQWCQRFAQTFEGDEENAQVQVPKLKVCLRHEAVAELQSLYRALFPLIDSYWGTAVCLERLIGQQTPERDFIQDVLAEIKTRLEIGTIRSGTSLCVENIRNALKLFETWGVLESHQQDRIKLYYLNLDYESEEQLQSVVCRFMPFRR